jgi:hypothetical protein
MSNPLTIDMYQADYNNAYDWTTDPHGTGTMTPAIALYDSDAFVRDIMKRDDVVRVHERNLKSQTQVGMLDEAAIANGSGLMRAVGAREYAVFGSDGGGGGSRRLFPDAIDGDDDDTPTWFVSEKYDGWHGIWTGTRLLSKTGVDWTSHIPSWWMLPRGTPLEGEVFMGWGLREHHGHQPDPNCLDMRFIVFDIPGLNVPFRQRRECLLRIKKDWEPYQRRTLGLPGRSDVPVSFAEHVPCRCLKDIILHFTLVTSNPLHTGEGVMIRLGAARYGGGHHRTRAMIKLKPEMVGVGLAIGDIYTSTSSSSVGTLYQRRVRVHWSPDRLTPHRVVPVLIARTHVSTISPGDPVPFMFYNPTDRNGIPTFPVALTAASMLKQLRIPLPIRVTRGVGQDVPMASMLLMVSSHPSAANRQPFLPAEGIGAMGLYPPWHWSVSTMLNPVRSRPGTITGLPRATTRTTTGRRPPRTPVGSTNKERIAILGEHLLDKLGAADNVHPQRHEMVYLLCLLGVLRISYFYCEPDAESGLSSAHIEIDPRTGMVWRLVTMELQERESDVTGQMALTLLACLWANTADIITTRIEFDADTFERLMDTVYHTLIEMHHDWDPLLSDHGHVWDTMASMVEITTARHSGIAIPTRDTPPTERKRLMAELERHALSLLSATILLGYKGTERRAIAHRYCVDETFLLAPLPMTTDADDDAQVSRSLKLVRRRIRILPGSFRCMHSLSTLRLDRDSLSSGGDGGEGVEDDGVYTVHRVQPRHTKWNRVAVQAAHGVVRANILRGNWDMALHVTRSLLFHSPTTDDDYTDSDGVPTRDEDAAVVVT